MVSKYKMPLLALLAIAILFLGYRIGHRMYLNSLPASDVIAKVTIEEVKVGEGPVASAGSNVKVHFVLTLAGKGTELADTRKQPHQLPSAFTIGRHQVLAGTDQGVEGMQVGGMRKVSIPPQLAYGDAGVPPFIPPNSTLDCTIELIAIEDKQK